MTIGFVAPLAGASSCESTQSNVGADGGHDAPLADAATAPGAPDGAGVSPDASPSGGAVSVPTGSPITLSGRAADGTVSGTYKDPRTQLIVSFSVRATGETSAVASYRVGTLEVQVSLSGPSTATITMADIGASITGYGEMPTDDASQRLLAFLGDMFGPGIRAIPLELNCGTGFAPAEIAALLVPWQVVYKYQLGPATRDDDVRAAAEAATCATMAFAGASPTQPAQPITKNAGAGLINLGNDDSLPTVFGFFPLDGSGSKVADGWAAVTPLAISTMKFGPCDSMCRGACGADCEANNCNSATGLSRCEVDAMGANTCFKLVYTDYTCGTHPACIAHDECYDACNAQWGCGSFDAAVCMHAVGHSVPFFVSCDQRVADVYGVSQGVAWARGLGPYTDSQTYRYVSSREWDATTCPCQHERRFTFVGDLDIGGTSYFACTLAGSSWMKDGVRFTASQGADGTWSASDIVNQATAYDRHELQPIPPVTSVRMDADPDLFLISAVTIEPASPGSSLVNVTISGTQTTGACTATMPDGSSVPVPAQTYPNQYMFTFDSTRATQTVGVQGGWFFQITKVE